MISKSKGELAKRLPARIKFYDYQTFCKRHSTSIRFSKIRNGILNTRTSTFEYFLDSVAGSQSSLYYVNTLHLPEAVNYLVRRNYAFVVHIHEMQHRLAKLRYKDLVNMVNSARYIFTSSKVCRDMMDTLGRRDQITHIYPGLELERVLPNPNAATLKEALRIDKSAFVITMCGTVDANKGPEIFLEIGRILADNGFNIHLLWIGVHSESAYFNFLERKSEKLGLKGRCSWIKKQEGPAYYEYLDLADCFILTSLQESFSIVLVEALALGKPVFSFKSGGPEEIINTENIGRLIEDYSATKMAEGIMNLMTGQISFNAKMAKERANEFKIDSIVSTWADCLRRLLE